jgi:hypothetical protein
LGLIDLAKHPKTILYDDAQNLTPSLIATNHETTIRILDASFYLKLLQKFNGLLFIIQ